MNKYKSVIVGIDPDSDRLGVAVYFDLKLEKCESALIHDIFTLLITLKDKTELLEVHIEDLEKISYSGFHINKYDSTNVKLKKAESVGRCKQAQRIVTQFCNSNDILIFNHKISSNWKKGNGKFQFKLSTGYSGRSNEDSRSAAWFGFEGCDRRWRLIHDLAQLK